MKKTTLLLFVLLSFSLSNCKKTAVSASTDTSQTAALGDEALSTQTLLLIQSVRNLPSQSMKRIAFRLLNASEKRAIWLDNIKTVSANYTPEQKAVATELSNILTQQMFEISPALSAAITRDQWLTKAEKVLSDDQIRALAFQLYVSTDHIAINNSGLKTDMSDPNKPDCDCAHGSSWSCSNTTVCSSIYFVDCNKSTWGCGFAWWSPCDNICVDPNG